jgi:hypothetical protein
MANNVSKNERKSVNLLPSYFQTKKNTKFLSSTIDQLYKVPVLNRVSGYVGSKLTPTYNSVTDVYVNDANSTKNSLRDKYQFQPALTIKTVSGAIKKALGLDDLVNQISVQGGSTDNLNSLFSPEVNSYNPHIDWDKFINFSQYYWLTTGPETITVTGLQKSTVSTYNVTDSADKNFFIFTPDGVTENPLLTLYKGVTYVFNVNSSHNFYIKTTNLPGDSDALPESSGILNNGIKQGQIIFSVPETLPGILYYASNNENVVVGTILIRDIEENSSIDVEQEILGKVTYKTAPTTNTPNGIEFINGLKIRFAGQVTPEYYNNKEFIVEGVGNAIKLVDFAKLQTPENLATIYDDDFDVEPFDEYPFDSFKNLPIDPEYVTINRSSQDLNPWSRYNRWFHQDVIEISAMANGVTPTLLQNLRARRPIVEFEADIQLYNFGNNSLDPVDLIDQVTSDVFSSIEGSTSYTVDGVALEPGQRIIFNADPDPLVRGKIFQVGLSLINGVEKINLAEIIEPIFGNSTVILLGTKGQGKEFWFNGLEWVLSQQRTVLNQAPLFDLFDETGHSYSDKTYYNAIFLGNKLFGYSIGTGIADPVLGFPLNYKNVGIEGSYLFENYFNTSNISLLGTNTVTDVSTSKTFLRINKDTGYSYKNVWEEGMPYQMPVQQFQVVSTGNLIPITVFDNAALITDLTIEVFSNNVKLMLDVDYTLVIDKTNLNVQFVTPFTSVTNVLIKCYTASSPNENGIYEFPLNSSNNPLNEQISQFTLSELSDHVQTMVNRDPNFVGVFPGVSNLKSLPFITKYGTRMITSYNPMSFAQLFITDIEHNLINATRSTANDYYQFKLNLIKFITQSDASLSPSGVLDQALSSIIKNKNYTFPYSQSDMLGYGTNNVTRKYTVTDARNVRYPLISTFDITQLSTRSVLIYLNGSLLVYGVDYSFDLVDPVVVISATLTRGDIITVVDYITTVGSYVPPTPSKLGLYPKYVPMIYKDESYAVNAHMVIQGHDGSITLAYTTVANAAIGNYDFRDLALLEYERRVFNNIKVTYDPDLININDILPGVFRDNKNSYNKIYNIVQGDFIKWTSSYGIDYSSNVDYNVDNHKTYNYKSTQDYFFNSVVPGNWRGIYKFYFDTDRPNTHPWEMLGFSIKPSWWESEYGPAPYTSGNLNLWEDLEAGLIRYGERAGVDPTYVRTGLSKIIPVDDSGQLIDLRFWGSIAENENILNPDQDWSFGDHGPAETAWRRSSIWPYAVQIILALSKPASYAAKMFDPIRLVKNVDGQYRYGKNSLFLNPSIVYLNSDIDSNGNTVLSSGYSVMVIESGKKRSLDYLAALKQDLSLVNFNLFYKAGGFLSKDKLEITIDSVSPNTVSPGVLLPNEDYALHFNVSNPVKFVSISGIIVEKKNGKFLVKGYDKKDLFFTINAPLHRNNDASISVGGKSPPVLTWTENTFYQAGQYVKYENSYYSVATSTNSGSSFDVTAYIKLANLPTIGGATVSITKDFDQNQTIIPYGTQYSTTQEVYDLIVGYGKYLTNQGFIFNEYNSDLEQVLDWNFSGKEFLYWTTQNWSNGSVITLSPFSGKIQYKFTDAVVDNVLNSFYDYSLLTANGTPFPPKNFSLSRENGICKISAEDTPAGLYFARLNLIQKEHAIVMANSSMFGDVVYDTQTGYRQARMKISGFITGDWNGDFLSPGFVYDDVTIEAWQANKDYDISSVVKYSGKYYSANENITGTSNFNFTKWNLLGSSPIAQLLPNFDYKINQFEDFYSLDIDNFDIGQQKMAQHLTGYTPRGYLTNIIVDPIAQYKFYQGFIREKGTANSISKLSKASIHNLNGQIEFDEEWAFRVGSYGNFISYNEIELPLRESDFIENNQIIKFVDVAPKTANDVISYVTPNDVTIKNYDYSSNNVFLTYTSSTYKNNNLLLPTAGYVRSDDITATAYNKQSLFDVANAGNLQDGNTVWLGFKPNGDWDVYRYSKQQIKVIGSDIDIPAVKLTFYTDIFHKLNVGDIVSVYGLDNGTDGIYEIIEIPSLTSFSVNSTLATVSPATTQALLFKFISVRVKSFDDTVALQDQIDFADNELIWTDTGDATYDWSPWTVYKKNHNYSTSTEILSGVNHPGQRYGYNIATQEDADKLIISAPDYFSSSGHGRVFVLGLLNGTHYPITSYTLNMVASGIDVITIPTEFGKGLAYDTEYQVIVAGAPAVDRVQISTIIPATGEEKTLSVLNTSTASRYGSDIFVAKTQFTTGGKALVVSAPTLGVVFPYTLTVNSTTAITVPMPPISLGTSTVNCSLAGNIDGTILAIANPAMSTGTGVVYIYQYSTGTSSYSLLQTITPPTGTIGDQFGTSVSMSDDGGYLFASSPFLINDNYGPGCVYVYEYVSTATSYSLVQTIHNPLKNNNLNFGTELKTTVDAKKVIISLSGIQENSLTFNDGTVFDGLSTRFTDYINNSGTVYTYERKNKYFVYATELFDANSLTILNGELYGGNNYGKSIAVNNGNIFIGAPDTLGIISNNFVTLGAVFQYNVIDASQTCWSIFRQQEDLIDLTKIKRSVTVNTESEQLVDYLDIIDPVKGKISGLADQEIRYKTAFDPATYSVGTQGVVVNTKTSWIEDRVGELWWDLSTVKYVWYEQSDLEYRKNSWGTLFPGASIDVYEWVQTEYLPSQWSALADTTDGLSKGISGQPKYPDNSVMSIKQYYNPSTGQATNVYFYWVKNKVLLPNAKGRKIPASTVASLIFDPASYGSKFVSILAPNAIAVANVKNTLVGNQIYLNISKDTLNNSVTRHTEWLLLGEGNSANMPTEMLDKKLLDSLVGRDSLGNLVPDPSLSNRVKYGIEVRPRQGMFVDRNQALRNVIDYVNGVVAGYLITDQVNFKNLNSKREIPDVYSREYDQIVDSYGDLSSIKTADLVQAKLTCSISSTTGTITTINIVNSGTGYAPLLPVTYTGSTATSWAGPLVTVVNDTSDAEIDLVINQYGRVTAATIKNSGKGYLKAPELKVRPYTVIVKTDENSNNRWAKYEWQGKSWVKVFTQDFDTTQYWDYINWVSQDFDSLKPLAETVEETYQLAEITVNNGDYVKVKNQGNGRYIILQKVSSAGDYTDKYNLMVNENGTIKFKDNLWNITNNWYNFDYHFTYDQTLYDQTPEMELINILKAIKEDIFIGSLKVYWNHLFFKAVRYAMSEQKFVDWAFKTAFINVRNLAGTLDQRPVFKFQNSQYYEQYIEEVKPYHTKIRNYQVNYNLLEPSNSYITDFDSPAYYDRDTDQFLTVNPGDELSGVYPWKSWTDNYKLSVGSIIVEKPGAGYTSVPTVEIIPALGDTGSGATAEARISLGKVTGVVVTNGGSGYLQTPSVIIVGGGSTELVTAKAYPVMINGKVRNNTVEMKFDRISSNQQINTSTVTESFICDGETFRFTLGWAAENKKANINITLGGVRVLATDYNIETYRKTSSGFGYSYKKLFSDLVLTSAPAQGKVIQITYNKNINLYSAVDRIYSYYQPSINMPGVDPAQLMTGVEYPAAQKQGLMFDYSTNWGLTPFGQSLYGDDVYYYTTASVISVAVTGTDTLMLDNLAGIYPGLRINTVSTSTPYNKFVDPIVTVVSVNTASQLVTFSTSTISTVGLGTLIEFWEFNMVPGVLDTILDGGDLAYTLASGLNPEDIIVDGEGFISPNISHAPEEMIKGEIHESLGMSVYARDPQTGAPVVSETFGEITQTTQTTVLRLLTVPPTTASAIVSFNNELLVPGVDYEFDLVNSTIVIGTQTTTGLVGVSVIGVGGYDYVSSGYTALSNTSTISVSVGVNAEYNTIYATLNGQELLPSQYTLGQGLLTVTGVNPAITNVLQSWVFFGTNRPYSAVREQSIFNNDPARVEWDLFYPLNDNWSADSQAIVEVDSRILIPPNTSYHLFTGVDLKFSIDPNNSYPPNSFGLSSLDVYVNGLRMIPLTDYVVNSVENKVKFRVGLLQLNDVIAITNHEFSDYYFNESRNTIVVRPSADFTYTKIMRIITINNITVEDGIKKEPLIELETFQGRGSRRYEVSRPIFNNNYVWVTVNRKPLVKGIDFYVDADRVTIVLRDSYPYNPSDIVTIMSMYDTSVGNTIGYRMFRDMLNRTEFLRLSKDSSTVLAEPLYPTDKIITVADAGKLALPNLALKIPGVIFIGGERIEYRSVNENVLGNLTRATLGTGAKSVYAIGTSVIDQGARQNLYLSHTPFREITTVTSIMTATGATSYTISALSLNTTTGFVTATNQITVLYGGTPLRKTGFYQHDITVSYDTPAYTLNRSTVATQYDLPPTTVIGTAYLVTSTNEIWSYTASKSESSTATNGYSFTGVRWVEPQFTLTNVVTVGQWSTATLVLNLPTLSTSTGVRIEIVQRIASTNFYELNNTPLIDDTGKIAQFLRDKQATLPDKYYYG